MILLLPFTLILSTLYVTAAQIVPSRFETPALPIEDGPSYTPQSVALSNEDALQSSSLLKMPKRAIKTVTSSFTTVSKTVHTPTPLSVPSKAPLGLITHMRDRILADYEMYSKLYCLYSGSTFDCRGPWLYGNSWNNKTLASRLYENTKVRKDYECSSDISYLAPENTRRSFYGFTAQNLTSSLTNAAHILSLYAAGSCSLNTTCQAPYHNNTGQMYKDYRRYIDTGFFAELKSQLARNSSFSYCPASIFSTASMINFLTAHFDGGREYYGLHNPIFKPGVIKHINGSQQEARVAASQYFSNNARRIEAVYLNMIFFSYDKDRGLLRRNSDPVVEEEIYPGCTRKEWISKGHCEGVIPPRNWDLDGSVIPMKDRDLQETYAELSHPLANTGLIPRDSSACSKLSSIDSHLKQIEAAILISNTVSNALLAVNVYELVEVAAVLGPAGLAPVVGALGTAYVGLSILTAVCDAFHTCNGVPDALVKSVKVLTTAGAAGQISMVPLVKAGISLAGAANGLVALLANALLGTAQSYYEGAEKCCEVNCGGAVCQQAGAACALTFSSDAGHGLNCAAQ